MPTQATPASNHFFSRVLGAVHPAGRHDAGPRTGRQHRFDEVRPADRVAREYLDDLAAQLFGIADLGDRTATGAVGDLATIADLGHIDVEQRTDHEFRAIGDVDAGGRRVDDGADAHDHAGVRLGEVTRDVEEDMGCEIAAIGELDAFGAAVGAGLDDLFADVDIGVIKNRDNALAHHGRQHGHTVNRHGSISSAVGESLTSPPGSSYVAMNS